jgi:hypothetical protein
VKSGYLPGGLARKRTVAGRSEVRRTLDRETIVPFLVEIFERRGAEEYLGESVTMGRADAMM